MSKNEPKMFLNMNNNTSRKICTDKIRKINTDTEVSTLCGKSQFI